MTKQNKDFEWFVFNNKRLFKKYGEKFLAIKDQKVIGVFDNYADAVRQTSLKEKLGTFIVQQCGKDDSVYTSSIVSVFISKKLI